MKIEIMGKVTAVGSPVDTENESGVALTVQMDGDLGVATDFPLPDVDSGRAASAMLYKQVKITIEEV